MSNKVIVFGPTGNVGSQTARAAHKNGAKVYLAMRDTSKSIPGLSTEQEKQGGFERITADLLKADTVAASVGQTGAKRAFIYLTIQSQDHMKATLEALKASGVDFVVFLSSYTVSSKPNLADFSQSERTPYIHAQVELNIQRISGPECYVALRPGAFTTNALKFWGKAIEAGEVRMFGGDVKYDWTTPEDMGGVAGVILAQGVQDSQKVVYIFGPQFISRLEAFEVLRKKVLRQPVMLTIVTSEDGHVANLVSTGNSQPVARYLAHDLATTLTGEKVNEFQNL